MSCTTSLRLNWSGSNRHPMSLLLDDADMDLLERRMREGADWVVLSTEGGDVMINLANLDYIEIRGVFQE